ncbi:sugar ABC transporter substrate-binding protein [Nakamurella sp. A5-74]|uniref:Sugar ABC transporter substrate-binding protein n=1 Tax=Nakamurella sp. A5-74 TaxID=3158264 RepID=A0AAU8DUK5_9ACTN
MKFRRFGILAAAVAVTLVAGCSNGAPAASSTTAPAGSSGSGNPAPAASAITVAVITHAAPGDSFWDVVKSGAEAAGKQENVTVTYAGDPDPAKQSQLIDNAIAQGVQGIAVSMANPDGVKDAIARATAKNIPVITINSGLEQSKAFGAITHVGQSEELAGEGAGSKFKELGGTKMLCVIHEAGNVGLEQRCAGAAKTFGSVENLQVDVSNAADAQNTIKSKLLADKSIDAVLTLNPVIGKAAVAAVGEAKSTAKIATFDVSTDVLDAVIGGQILFAVDQQPYLQGYLPVVFFALKVRNGNDVGGGQPVYSGPGFVTKDNAAQVKQFAAAGTR